MGILLHPPPPFSFSRWNMYNLPEKATLEFMLMIFLLTVRKMWTTTLQYDLVDYFFRVFFLHVNRVFQRVFVQCPLFIFFYFFSNTKYGAKILHPWYVERNCRERVVFFNLMTLTPVPSTPWNINLGGNIISLKLYTYTIYRVWYPLFFTNKYS